MPGLFGVKKRRKQKAETRKKLKKEKLAKLTPKKGP